MGYLFPLKRLGIFSIETVFLGAVFVEIAFAAIPRNY